MLTTEARQLPYVIQSLPYERPTWEHGPAGHEHYVFQYWDQAVAAIKDTDPKLYAIVEGDAPTDVDAMNEVARRYLNSVHEMLDKAGLGTHVTRILPDSGFVGCGEFLVVVSPEGAEFITANQLGKIELKSVVDARDDAAQRAINTLYSECTRKYFDGSGNYIGPDIPNTDRRKT